MSRSMHQSSSMYLTPRGTPDYLIELVCNVKNLFVHNQSMRLLATTASAEAKEATVVGSEVHSAGSCLLLLRRVRYSLSMKILPKKLLIWALLVVSARRLGAVTSFESECAQLAARHGDDSRR